MTRCAVYLRVSTAEQETANQLPAIQAFAASRGWEISETYQENESAWRAGHQHELARLLDSLRSGQRKYDVCLVWSLDRVTREGIGTLLTVYNEFNRLGCRLISVKESFTEFPNEFTPIFLAMLGFFAKWESDRRSERTRAGLARAKAAKGGKLATRGKDKGARRKGGYIARYQQKKVRQTIGVGNQG